MSKKVMERNADGTFGEIKAWELAEKLGTLEIGGTQPTYGMVSVDIKSQVNRVTNYRNIQKNLKDGWNWNLFVPIMVAIFPKGYTYALDGEIPELVDMILLDGDHRRLMYKISFPNEGQMPAMFHKVKDMQEFHSLFTKINKFNRKTASAEEVFVHQVKSGTFPEALRERDALIECGLSVFCTPENGGVVGSVTGPRVKIGGFKRALKSGDGISNVRAAAALIKKTWAKDIEVQAELLEGISVLFKYYPKLLKPRTKVANHFAKYFSNNANYDQKNRATHFKKSGGGIVNKAALCTARGILDDIREYKSPGESQSEWSNRKKNDLPMNRLSKIISP
jgi:hypothetical protein